MANLGKSIKDYGLQILRELLKVGPEAEKKPGQKAKASLDDLSLDDLRREKIRFDQEERKMPARLREVEAQKRKLFEDGVQNASEREQRVIARRIKEVDVEAASMDRMLQAISKQMRIINGLLQVKERYRVLAESGISGILKDIDLQDLIIYIDKASVDGEFHMDKFDELLRTLEEAEAISPDYKEDKDVLEIMQAMQRAHEAADSPEAMEEEFKEMSQRIKPKKEETQLELGEEEI